MALTGGRTDGLSEAKDHKDRNFEIRNRLDIELRRTLWSNPEYEFDDPAHSYEKGLIIFVYIHNFFVNGSDLAYYVRGADYVELFTYTLFDELPYDGPLYATPVLSKDANVFEKAGVASDLHQVEELDIRRDLFETGRLAWKKMRLAPSSVPNTEEKAANTVKNTPSSVVTDQQKAVTGMSEKKRGKMRAVDLGELQTDTDPHSDESERKRRRVDAKEFGDKEKMDFEARVCKRLEEFTQIECLPNHIHSYLKREILELEDGRFPISPDTWTDEQYHVLNMLTDITVLGQEHFQSKQARQTRAGSALHASGLAESATIIESDRKRWIEEFVNVAYAIRSAAILRQDQPPMDCPTRPNDHTNRSVDVISKHQQEAVMRVMEITAQDPDDSTKLLSSCLWNVDGAVSRWFDARSPPRDTVESMPEAGPSNSKSPEKQTIWIQCNTDAGPSCSKGGIISNNGHVGPSVLRPQSEELGKLASMARKSSIFDQASETERRILTSMHENMCAKEATRSEFETHADHQQPIPKDWHHRMERILAGDPDLHARVRGVYKEMRRKAFSLESADEEASVKASDSHSQRGGEQVPQKLPGVAEILAEARKHAVGNGPETTPDDPADEASLDGSSMYSSLLPSSTSDDISDYQALNGSSSYLLSRGTPMPCPILNPTSKASSLGGWSMFDRPEPCSSSVSDQPSALSRSISPRCTAAEQIETKIPKAHRGDPIHPEIGRVPKRDSPPKTIAEGIEKRRLPLPRCTRKGISIETNMNIERQEMRQSRHDSGYNAWTPYDQACYDAQTSTIKPYEFDPTSNWQENAPEKTPEERWWDFFHHGWDDYYDKWNAVYVENVRHWQREWELKKHRKVIQREIKEIFQQQRAEDNIFQGPVSDHVGQRSTVMAARTSNNATSTEKETARIENWRHAIGGGTSGHAEGDETKQNDQNCGVVVDDDQEDEESS